MTEKCNIKKEKRNIIDEAYFKLNRKYVQVYTTAFENLDKLGNFLENNKLQSLAEKIIQEQ